MVEDRQQTVQSVCIFCGASTGSEDSFAEATKEVVTSLVRRNIRVVYGGGKAGLMGVVADTALKLGGRVVGVMPQHLVDREIAHDGLSELHVTDSMHDRKKLMGDLSDGFVALPGGFGTLEELSEVLSWAQIGLHTKPIGLLDTNGFFAPLLSFFDTMVANGFLRSESRSLIIRDDDPERLLTAMGKRPRRAFDRWTEPGKHAPG